MYVWLLLSLVSLAMMLLAVETQVSDWLVRFDPCIVSVISVVVLLVKFVGGCSLMFVCSVNKSFVGRR